MSTCGRDSEGGGALTCARGREAPPAPPVAAAHGAAAGHAWVQTQPVPQVGRAALGLADDVGVRQTADPQRADSVLRRAARVPGVQLGPADTADRAGSAGLRTETEGD